MGMPYTAKMIKRDESIVALYERGWTYQRIADRYGLTSGRIFQILAKTGARRAA
jgi:Mor family transcriptional regulator